MPFHRFNFILLKTRVNIYIKNLLKLSNPPIFNTNTRTFITQVDLKNDGKHGTQSDWQQLVTVPFDRFILLKTRVNIYKKNLLKLSNPSIYNINTRTVITRVDLKIQWWYTIRLTTTRYCAISFYWKRELIYVKKNLLKLSNLPIYNTNTTIIITQVDLKIQWWQTWYRLTTTRYCAIWLVQFHFTENES